MRALVLLLAWITPAFIAGALGWSGVWGAGSALGDYLIPIPVAGGAMHVPSFLVLALIVMTIPRAESKQSYLPIFAFGIAAGMLAAMLDFERLNGWLFTDYTPHGSPLRFDGNALFLFVTTDACWAGIFALAIGRKPPPRSWLLLPAVPLVLIAVQAVVHRVGGPVFEIGSRGLGTSPGEETRYVYTSAAYDETLFVRWFEEKSLSVPWQSPNTEHVAIVFTNSLQHMKWHWREDYRDGDDHVVATICLYEEDRAIVPHEGSYDCFAERDTFAESLAAMSANTATGLGRDIDAWYALMRLCDGVDIVGNPSQDMARASRCLGAHRTFTRNLERLADKYGADSPQVAFVLAQGASRNLSME